MKEPCGPEDACIYKQFSFYIKKCIKIKRHYWAHLRRTHTVFAVFALQEMGNVGHTDQHDLGVMFQKNVHLFAMPIILMELTIKGISVPSKLLQKQYCVETYILDPHTQKVDIQLPTTLFQALYRWK